MKRDIFLQVSLVIASLIACSSCYRYNNGLVGTPCNLNTPCGQRILLSEDTQRWTSISKPNVCITTRNYMQHYYNGVYVRKCYYSYWRGYYCRLKCSRTDTCNATKTVTTTEYHCCPGYRTPPATNSFYYYLFRNSRWYLMKYGCPAALRDSVIDCIEQNGLSVLTELFNKTELGAKLSAQNSSDKYTLFAVPNELIPQSVLNLSPPELELVLGGHVIPRELHSILLFDDSNFPVVSPGRYLHVGKVEERNVHSWLRTSNDTAKTYINGIELLGGDGCFATNGIVHVVAGIITTSNSTIAQVIQGSPRLSMMSSLLSAANMIQGLDRSDTSKTFFAVTNEAFEMGSSDIGVDIVRCLLANGNERILAKFLKYHMTNGAEYEVVLTQKASVSSRSCSWVVYRRIYCYLRCEEIVITVSDDGVGVGKTGSVITVGDVPASNGVVHYISLPLIEPSLDLAQLCIDFPFNVTVSSNDK